MVLIVANYATGKNGHQKPTAISLLSTITNANYVCVLNIHMCKLTSNCFLVVLLYSIKFYSSVQCGVARIDIISNKNR